MPMSCSFEQVDQQHSVDLAAFERFLEARSDVDFDTMKVKACGLELARLEHLANDAKLRSEFSSAFRDKNFKITSFTFVEDIDIGRRYEFEATERNSNLSGTGRVVMAGRKGCVVLVEA